MAKRTLTYGAGGLSVQVEVPEEFPDPVSVVVKFHPADGEQFEAVAEGTGGLAGYLMPEHDESYRQAALLRPEKAGAFAVLLVEPPRDEAQAKSRPPHPFFSPLRERAGEGS